MIVISRHLSPLPVSIVKLYLLLSSVFGSVGLTWPRCSNMPPNGFGIDKPEVSSFSIVMPAAVLWNCFGFSLMSILPNTATATMTISRINALKRIFPCSGLGKGRMPETCNSVRIDVIINIATHTQIITVIGSKFFSFASHVYTKLTSKYIVSV